MPARPVTSRERGITLVEVLCALVVLSVALIAIFRTIESQTRNTAALGERTFAHWVAVNRLEEARLLGLSALPRGSDTVRMGGIDWTVETTREPGPFGLVRARVVVTAEGRAGAQLTGYLDPEAAS